MKKIRTWLQVYDRLGRQPFCKTKNLRIFLKKDEKKIFPWTCSGCPYYEEKKK